MARTERLEARITPADLAKVKRAAQAQRRSISEFVVDAALDAASEVLEEADIIRLTAEEQRRFVELMLKPPSPRATLKRAKAAHAKLFG
jgi:uncharacterized protein (DUF1778 family)